MTIEQQALLDGIYLWAAWGALIAGLLQVAWWIHRYGGKDKE